MTGYDGAVRLLVVANLLAGCSFSAPDGGGEFTCSAAKPECPTGTMCIEGRCRGAADAAPPAPFRYRRKLSFSNREGAALSEVPVLVALGADSFDYNQVQPGGADLRFFDADQTPLPHEIDEWNPAGRSFVWVEVPEVAGNSDQDHIWMYYGAPDLPPLDDAAEVWTAYQAVYHLGGSTEDSGPRGLDATPSGTEPTEGMVGTARGFDGEGEYMTIGERVDLLRSVPGMTLEGWVRPTPHAAERVVVAVSTSGSIESRAQFKVTSTGRVRLAFRSDDQLPSLVSLETAAPIAAQEWSWVSVVADLPADTATIYVNGVHIIQADAVGFDPVTVDTLPDVALIGIDEEDIEPFAGRVDELRIAGRAMSEAWVGLQYASMTGALITLGEPEAL